MRACCVLRGMLDSSAVIARAVVTASANASAVHSLITTARPTEISMLTFPGPITTGLPNAMPSTTGNPKPSKSAGKTPVSVALELFEDVISVGADAPKIGVYGVGNDLHPADPTRWESTRKL